MTGSDRRLLLVDGECGKCAAIAELVRGLHRRRDLEVGNLRSAAARDLLDGVLGAGWRWRPYYVTMTTDRVRAAGGSRLGWRLVREVGVAGAWQVWRAVRSNSATRPVHDPDERMSRRSALQRFARFALGVSGLVVGAVGATSPVREARANSPGLQTVILPERYWRPATRDEIPAELWHASGGAPTDSALSPDAPECSSCNWQLVGSCGSACNACPPYGFLGPNYYYCIDPAYGTVCNTYCGPCNQC